LYANWRRFDLKLPACSISSWVHVWHGILQDSTMSGTLPTSHKSKSDTTLNIVIICNRLSHHTALQYNAELKCFNSEVVKIDRNSSTTVIPNNCIRDWNRRRWANTCRRRQLQWLSSTDRSIDAVWTRKQTHTQEAHSHTHTPTDKNKTYAEWSKTPSDAYR